MTFLNSVASFLQVLYDIGAVSGEEPFQHLVSQGMILGETEYSLWQDEAGGFVEPDTPGATPVRCFIKKQIGYARTLSTSLSEGFS